MFTDEEKIAFLACDTFDEFKHFINQFEINKFDQFGNTILHYYLKNFTSFKLDPKQVVLEMFNHGININAQSSKGNFRNTPLNLSVKDELKDIFELLIELGSDVNLTTVNGNSVLSNVMLKTNIDSEFFITKLIKNGADVYLKNDYGVSPISIAHTICNYNFEKYFSKFDYTEEI